MDRTEFRECRALLFDFGGTIDSDGEHWLDRFFSLYEGEGLAFQRDEIKRAFYEADSACHADAGIPSLGFRSLVNRHVRFQFDALGFRDAKTQGLLVDRFCDRAEHFFSLRTGLFRCLQDRFRAGVVSNFFGNLEVVLEEAGLAGAFEVVIDSGRVGFSKPDHRIFGLALDRLGLPPGQVIFVGDSYERDMVPSKELGIKTIWLKGPNPRVPENAPPVDAVITRLAELEALVR
ncbi:MAG: HAD family hydrolase [Syntrophorhabdales bacterium]|jgi:putative hydrolase of the HAD superfamily